MEIRSFETGCTLDAHRLTLLGMRYGYMPTSCIIAWVPRVRTRGRAVGLSTEALIYGQYRGIGV
eukprot:6156138-Heterocapsa_arctica.AAC.1